MTHARSVDRADWLRSPAMTDVDIRTGTVTANGLTFSYLEAGTRAPRAVSARLSRLRRRVAAAARSTGRRRASTPWRRTSAATPPPRCPPTGATNLGCSWPTPTRCTRRWAATNAAVIIGHDWGAFAAYGAPTIAPDRWRGPWLRACRPPRSSMPLLLYLRHSQAQLLVPVRVLQSPRRPRRADERLRVPRSALGRLVPGARRLASPSWRSRPRCAIPPTSPPRSATTGTRSASCTAIPLCRPSRAPACSCRRYRRSTCTASTTAACPRRHALRSQRSVLHTRIAGRAHRRRRPLPAVRATDASRRARRRLHHD